MRSSTKTFVASVGLGVCALSYAVGANSATGSSFMADGVPSVTDTAAPTDPKSGNSQGTATPTTSSAGASAANTTAAAANTKGNKKKPKAKGTKKPSTAKPAPSKSASSAPAPSKSTTPAPAPSKTTTPPAPSTKTSNTGNVFTERNYGGRVQITVTKTNGKVTAVDFVVATATDGRARAFPSLAQMAVASNGAAVSNVGGATFTTNTFNQALASAMSKF